MIQNCSKKDGHCLFKGSWFLPGWTEESGLICRIFLFHPSRELCHIENPTINTDESEPTSTVNRLESKKTSKTLTVFAWTVFNLRQCQ
jgi:hypothetical protein